MQTVLSGWKSPCIVVFGAENSGKSTILERICMFPIFPRAQRLCTRMPIEVQLRQHKETQDIVMETIDLTGQEVTTSRKIIKRDEVSGDTIRNEMTRLVKEENDIAPGSAATVQGVAMDSVIRLSISGPDVPNLDLIDLPGIVAYGRAGEPEDLPEKTKALVERTIARVKDRAIFLAVSPYDEQPHDSHALGVVNREAIGKDTIGVLTKCDKEAPKQRKAWDSDDEEDHFPQVLARLKQDSYKTKPLENGYVATGMYGEKSDDKMAADDPQAEIDRMQRLAEKETLFFGEYASVFSGFDTTANCLIDRVGVLYYDYLKAKWVPRTLGKLACVRADTVDRIHDMGMPLAHAEAWAASEADCAQLEAMLQREGREAAATIIADEATLQREGREAAATIIADTYEPILNNVARTHLALLSDEVAALVKEARRKMSFGAMHLALCTEDGVPGTLMANIMQHVETAVAAADQSYMGQVEQALRADMGKCLRPADGVPRSKLRLGRFSKVLDLILAQVAEQTGERRQMIVNAVKKVVFEAIEAVQPTYNLKARAKPTGSARSTLNANDMLNSIVHVVGKRLSALVHRQFAVAADEQFKEATRASLLEACAEQRAKEVQQVRDIDRIRASLVQMVSMAEEDARRAEQQALVQRTKKMARGEEGAEESKGGEPGGDIDDDPDGNDGDNDNDDDDDEDDDDDDGDDNGEKAGERKERADRKAAERLARQTVGPWYKSDNDDVMVVLEMVIAQVASLTQANFVDKTLSVFSLSDSGKVEFAEGLGLGFILEPMQNNVGNEKIQRLGMGAIATLCSGGKRVQNVMIKAGVPDMIVAALKQHPAAKGMEEACWQAAGAIGTAVAGPLGSEGFDADALFQAAADGVLTPTAACGAAIGLARDADAATKRMWAGKVPVSLAGLRATAAGSSKAALDLVEQEKLCGLVLAPAVTAFPDSSDVLVAVLGVIETVYGHGGGAAKQLHEDGATQVVVGVLESKAGDRAVAAAGQGALASANRAFGLAALREFFVACAPSNAAMRSLFDGRGAPLSVAPYSAEAMAVVAAAAKHHAADAAIMRGAFAGPMSAAPYSAEAMAVVAAAAKHHAADQAVAGPIVQLVAAWAGGGGGGGGGQSGAEEAKVGAAGDAGGGGGNNAVALVDGGILDVLLAIMVAAGGAGGGGSRSGAVGPVLGAIPFDAELNATQKAPKADDGKGAIHWIGTNEGKEAWTNPAVAGRMKVTRSSDNGGKASNAVGDRGKGCYTKNEAGSYFMFDLMRHEVAPFFRFFRVYQTGCNHNGSNFLCLSGFEVWGAVRVRQ
eukprot:g1478.t1